MQPVSQSRIPRTNLRCSTVLLVPITYYGVAPNIVSNHKFVCCAACRRDDDADRRDDDDVVDVEGGESDGTAKNTETELNMRMFCKYCCKYDKAGSFVVGSAVFKLESVKVHNSSASHMK